MKYTNGEINCKEGDYIVFNGKHIYNVTKSWLLNNGFTEVIPEPVKPYEPTQEELNLQEIERLKQELSTYDYIGIKIAMGVATTEEYAEKIAYTEELRRKINALQELTKN